MTIIVRRALTGFSVALFTLTCVAVAQQMPRTTKESIAGPSSVKTEHLKGTVVLVEGNKLAVRLANGQIRNFEPPESRRFMVDGKELTVGELKPGTTLTATVTTTTTPITERTTTVGTGKVWYVAGNTVILTLPNNENRQYKVSESYRFVVDGKKASVHDLRKGMTIAAERIVEEPRTEIASNTVVTGHAPPPPEPMRSTTTTATRVPEPPTPAPAVAHAPKPTPLGEPSAPAEPNPPAHLPHTASSLPLIGLAGLMLTSAFLVLRLLRLLWGS